MKSSPWWMMSLCQPHSFPGHWNVRLANLTWNMPLWCLPGENINAHTTDIRGFVSSSIMKILLWRRFNPEPRHFLEEILSNKNAVRQNCKSNLGHFPWRQLGKSDLFLRWDIFKSARRHTWCHSRFFISDSNNWKEDSALRLTGDATWLTVWDTVHFLQSKIRLKQERMVKC